MNYSEMYGNYKNYAGYLMRKFGLSESNALFDAKRTFLREESEQNARKEKVFARGGKSKAVFSRKTKLVWKKIRGRWYKSYRYV